MSDTVASLLHRADAAQLRFDAQYWRDRANEYPDTANPELLEMARLCEETAKSLNRQAADA